MIQDGRTYTKVVIANGGMIENEDGVAIISVDSSGNATVSGATFTPNNLTTTGNTTLGNAVTDTTAINGATTITSTSATALTVGATGSTNPAFTVDASTASSATGLKVKSGIATGGVAISVTSPETNENVTFDAKGSGTVTIAGTSTGTITLGRATNISGATVINGQLTANGPALLAFGESIVAGGGANCYVSIGSGATAPRVVAGSGAPTIAAPKGSLYLRIDGSGVADRAYINTDASTTWTAISTVA